MIRELAEFGKRIRSGHDALKDEPISIDLVIKEDGSFYNFHPIDKIFRPAEAVTAKKGRARLLLDKAEEVLNFVSPKEIKNAKNDIEKARKNVLSKHDLFLKKLIEYKQIDILKPVLLFYFENKENGLNQAVNTFELQFLDKEREGNIAFRVNDVRIHEQQVVYDAIIEKFEKEQSELLKGEKKQCSICGKFDFPIVDKPHGYIKNVPDGQEGKNVLVSFNEKAFESYCLKGNDNSSICTNCAKNYVEGLNWLLTHGSPKISEEVKGKSKSTYEYSHRKKFGKDTAMIYWTREDEPMDELKLLDNPDVGEISNLINSVVKGDHKLTRGIKTNLFYSCTLSGAAARIAVRDWIEISLADYRRNIARWFQDIAIQNDGTIKYSRLYFLAQAGHNSKLENDPTNSRIANHLWKTALLKDYIPPLWILASVLKRVRHIEPVEDGKKRNDPISLERAVLIRLIINRNNSKNGTIMKEQLDSANMGTAYMFGRIFAIQVAIQRAALGKNINAGIREVFFSFASTNPAPAFGRIMRQTQRHLTKLKQEDSGAFIVLDRKLQELCSKISPSDFPPIFSLEEQGQFALGYYQQKQKDYEEFKEHQNNKLKSTTEEE